MLAKHYFLLGVTLCSFVDSCRRFEGICYLYFLLWKKYVPPKLLYLSTTRNCISYYCL